MKVMLKEDIQGSGKKGDIVTVSDGYARNYLLPRNLAVEANNQVMGEFKSKQAAVEHRAEQEKQDALALADKIGEKTVKLTAKAGTKGRLFGSITAKEITETINKAFNCTIDKRKITLESEIKAFGTYTAQIKLHPGIIAKVYVAVSEEVK